MPLTKAYLASVLAESEPTHIESHVDAGRRFVELRGELDLATIGDLQAELLAPPTGPVVLDLSGVDFMDTSTLELLIRHTERVRIANPSQPVAHLLRLFGLETHLTVL